MKNDRASNIKISNEDWYENPGKFPQDDRKMRKKFLFEDGRIRSVCSLYDLSPLHKIINFALARAISTALRKRDIAYDTADQRYKQALSAAEAERATAIKLADNEFRKDLSGVLQYQRPNPEIQGI